MTRLHQPIGTPLKNSRNNLHWRLFAYTNLMVSCQQSLAAKQHSDIDQIPTRPGRDTLQTTHSS